MLFYAFLEMMFNVFCYEYMLNLKSCFNLFFAINTYFIQNAIFFAGNT